MPITSFRSRTLLVCLWLSVIAWSTWVGGTLYQILVVVPVWSASPPESLRAFLQETNYFHLIFRFFGPPFIAARIVPVVAALIAGWTLRQQRRLLLVATGCIAIIVIVTLAYVYPINAVLFAQGGGNNAPEAIRAMAHRWIIADRVRFAIGIVGFLAILQAFRSPVSDER